MRLRAVPLTAVLAVALLTACSSDPSSSADGAGRTTTAWYTAGGKDKISSMVSDATRVIDAVKAMDASGYSQFGLTDLSTRCLVLGHDVKNAEAYTPVPDEKTQYAWTAALGQLSQGADACRDAVHASGDVPAAVTASISTVKSGLANLDTVLGAVDTSAPSPKG
ncbi:hypothetical protein [Streptomyces sp. NRRL B-24484]|uniref:hypothetical protein n=1 Tax=Streptomyces sp. NRRL B-24484 TaxID=1463833 RepID=UPI0004BF643A|nr:hypothetical protein [Streptomyces sp. NRRL B-24484]